MYFLQSIGFSTQVLLDCGLCICFYDLLEAGDPIVYPAEGCCHQAVAFRLVVFRPFVGEIIIGKWECLLFLVNRSLHVKICVDILTLFQLTYIITIDC